MTTATLTTERLAQAVANLIDQFKGQPNIEAFIEAWAQQSQEVELAAFEVLTETTLDAAVGVQLDGLGDIVGVERAGLSDTDYRLRIRAQILLNNSSGTIDDIIQIAVALGATSVTLAEVFPAKIELNVTTPIASGEQIGTVLADATPAGVGYWFTWYESATPFLFDTAGQGFDQGGLGALLTA